MTQKLMALSFSRLSCFEQCPAKFDYLYVSKSVQDQDNQHTIYGTRVHTGLELYGRAQLGDVEAKALLAEDTGIADWGPHKALVDRIVARPGEKLFEQQMALDHNRVPCDWFSKDAWIRGIADVLVVDGANAWIGDWKTGKVKDNPTQLQLFALMVFAHYPDVQTVVTSFLWINHNDITTAAFKRSMVPSLWATLLPRFKAVQDTLELGFFAPKPSGLCPWCPAKDICPSARKRR